MDLDRFVAEHEPAWRRLDELATTGRRPRRLSATDLDEFVALYQRVGTHLSVARTQLDDPALLARLTTLVATAGGVLYGEKRGSWRSVLTLVTVTFPREVWRIRRFVLVAALLSFVPAVALGAWLATSPRAVEASAPTEVRRAYLERDFEHYYSSEPAATFASKVFTNNIRVAALAVASGITGGVLTAWILIENGASLGLAAGLFTAAGRTGHFWGLIIPHGALELSAVVVAGGAGLRLGWALIAPGDLTRPRALVAQGRRLGIVVLGLFGTLAIAGTIEGFITGRGVSTAARVTIGVVVASAFWTYLAVAGRIALRAEEAAATAPDGLGDTYSAPVALIVR